MCALLNFRTALLGVLLLIAGCSSQYRYHPTHSVGQGPYATEVTDNLYRVHYKILHNNPDEAEALALDHSRLLTQRMQFDWFVIVQRYLVIEELVNYKTNRIQRTECNQDKCQQSNYSNPQFKNQFEPSEPALTTEVVLHIRMGKGLRPDGIKSYSATSSF